jgi:hypothetical protein
MSYSEMQTDNFNREAVVKIIDGYFLSFILRYNDKLLLVIPGFKFLSNELDSQKQRNKINRLDCRKALRNIHCSLF